MRDLYPLGRVFWHRGWSERLRELLSSDRKTDLPRIPFYNLRHTAATLLLPEGVHPKLVQELLGHVGISTTLNTYSHVIPSLKRKTACAMEDMLE